ncbi:MAG TPA: GldG family protein [Planctomycetota bacterium]|nr:GldG family protein [Planctomycetota bacterium]
MVSVAVVVAVLVTVLANLLADRKFVRVDLTKEGRYSLSEPFERILSRLEDPATITYYISTQVPGWFEQTKRDILDKLREVETAARGKIKLEVIDPTDNKELVERLTKQGAQHQVQDTQKDSVSVMRLFTSVELTYQDKPKALINPIRAAEEIEYQLGSKILELTTKKKPILAVMAPPAPPQNPMMGQRGPQGSGYEWIWMNQSDWDDGMKFDVRNIDLTEGNTIPDGASLLILIRPKELNERQRFEVIKYLAGGGNVLLMASPFKIAHEFGWNAEKATTNLEDYLKEVGATYGADFVLDNSNVRMAYGLDLRTGKVLTAKLPLFVRVLAENVNQESVLTRLMPGLIMPTPAEIKLQGETLKKHGLTETILAKSSKQSWSASYTEAVDIERFSRYDEEKQIYEGPKNVFVMLEGQFPFPYEGKAVPDWKKLPEAQPANAKPPEQASVSKKPGRLILCSAPEAFHMMYLSNQELAHIMSANPKLLINIAESVSLGEDLIAIRSKRYETRTIDKLAGADNDAKRNAVKMALIIGIPMLVIAFGLIRAALRRDSQTRYERRFAASGPSSFTS